MKSWVIDNLPVSSYLSLRWWDYRINRRNQFARAQQTRRRITPNGSSYKPFDDKRAIFVHIPKCAGIAVNRALFGNLAGGHTTLDHYVEVFEPGAFQQYFKFTFVRNPWDRLVSAYHFLETGGMNQWDKSFYEKELSHVPDFRTFVLEWLTPETMYRYHHFKPQHVFLFDRYFKVSVDFIGQFENIDDDFKEIAKRLGCDAVLEKANDSARTDYRNYYDAKTRERVANLYRSDIALLGYSFEGGSDCPRRLDPRAARATLESLESNGSW